MGSISPELVCSFSLGPAPTSCHSHFTVIQQHPIHGADGQLRSLMGLEMDKAKASGAVIITHHLGHREKGQGAHPAEGSIQVEKHGKRIRSNI